VSFRTRLFLALLGAVLLPLALAAIGVRNEMESRLTAEADQRARDLSTTTRADLSREARMIGARLDALTAQLGSDNRLRLALLQDDGSARRYLLDYAGEAMRLTGLAMLQLQDSTGKILSSGHFRNGFDRMEPELPAALASAPDSVVLVRTPTAEASLLALTRSARFRVGGRSLTLVGGLAVDDEVVQGSTRGPDLAVTLLYPGRKAPPPPAGQVVWELPIPFLDLVDGTGARADTARYVVTQSGATLRELRRSVDRWFLGVMLATLALALLVASWLSARISQPLRDLAGKTARIDLERLDQDFATERQDEIGALSRLLGAMTERLRHGAIRLREAERRATVGDLARQVNHDIKNGLIPIRNVIRHLAQVTREDPAALAGVFAERQGTLDSSIAHLETLARNYARLSPNLGREPCDANAVAREVASYDAPQAVELRLAERLPPVLSDKVVLRRILENLVGNAVESLDPDAGGRVVVTTEPVPAGHDSPAVRITVADSGRGMTRTELDRAFDSFQSTKPDGTGLGLSIVRRLILDLNGSLRVETQPGVGTQVIVELPSTPLPQTEPAPPAMTQHHPSP
jgi:signal transduction histidine kinase